MLDAFKNFFMSPQFGTLMAMAGKAGAAIPGPMQGLGQVGADFWTGQKTTQIANQQSGAQPQHPTQVTFKYDSGVGKNTGVLNTPANSPAAASPTPAAAPDQAMSMQSMLPQLMGQGVQTQNFLQALRPLWR